MKKFLKFCKLPLTIISSVVLAAALVLIIVLYSVPHGTTYSATKSQDVAELSISEMEASEAIEGSVKAKITLTLKGDTAKIETKYDCSGLKWKKGFSDEKTLPYMLEGIAEMLPEGTKIETLEDFFKFMFENFDPTAKGIEVPYKVKDGKLFISMSDEEDEIEYVETGYLIDSFKITLDEKEAEDTYFGDLEFTCGTNVALRVVSIVFMVLGALALAGSVTVTILDKKGLLTKKEETTETAA